jgi:hypothetical protein
MARNCATLAILDSRRKKKNEPPLQRHFKGYVVHLLLICNCAMDSTLWSGGDAVVVVVVVVAIK